MSSDRFGKFRGSLLHSATTMGRRALLIPPIRDPREIVFRVGHTIGPPKGPPTLYIGSIFNDARLKVHRALEHAYQASIGFEAFFQHYANTLGRTTDAEGKHIFRVAFPTEHPRSVDLFISDALRCLRSSLDYLVCALAREHDIPDNNILFPFAEKRESLERSFAQEEAGAKKKRRAGALFPLVEKCPDLKKIILDDVQPYSRDDGAKATGDLIWRLIKTDNSDKHRLITPALGGSSVDSVTFKKDKDSSLTLENIGFAGVSDEFSVPIEEDTQIYAKGDFTLDIIFAPDTPLGGQFVFKALVEATEIISGVIEIFQTHFQGQQPPMDCNIIPAS